MKNTTTVLSTLMLVLAGSSFAQNGNWVLNPDNEGRSVDARLYSHLTNALENPTDDPRLPRVLLLGDSISIGYTVPVRQFLRNKANAHRPPENCQHTAYGLARLKDWLGSNKWDVIHFNWGIWDTHYLERKNGALVYDESKLAPEEMRVRHTPEQYRRNLLRIVELLQGTGAKLIWASTTPVLFRKGARLEDIAKYNVAAAEVMKERGIEIDDLYSLVLPEVARWQTPDQCHFNELGNENLGAKVGKSILEALTTPDKSAKVTDAGKAPSGAWQPTCADYDNVLRGADGRANIDATVARVKELGVGTYYYLVQPTTDWEDLKLFLPKAGEAGLQVWVYLVPPSEGGPTQPGPFVQDYVRWAEEIAQLSLQHTNLTGWVIDDFDGNLKFFTPGYVGQMQARAKGINSRLAFLPLTYFGSIRPFVNEYRELIDGVVVAYPQDRASIEQAWVLLNDATEVPLPEMNFPGGTQSRPGDFVMAAQRAKVGTATRYLIRFRDNFNMGPRGYHIKQLLIDGAMVWEEDLAGTKPGWHEQEVDVTSQVRGHTNATVAFRLREKEGVSAYGANWRFSDLRCEGLELAAGLDQPGAWQVSQRGAFETGFGTVARLGQRRFHIPFIVMTAANPGEFRGRHGLPGTPENMAQWLRMCLEAQRDGKCDAAVTFSLDKHPGSQAFDHLRDVFHSFTR